MTNKSNELFETLKKYIQSHTVDEILLDGLKQFFSTEEDATLETISSKYSDETFNELGEPLSYFRDAIEDISRNFCEYEEIYLMLKEEKSKQVFTNMLMAKVHMNISYIQEAYGSEDIYFDRSIWNNLSNETYVDCGGYTGDTALSFICHCPTFGKIYVLEPLEEAEKICKKNLDWFICEGSISVIKRAAYNSKTKLSFSRNHGTGDSSIDNEGEVQILSVRLDEIINEPVSFIKMDIEGSEKEALEGANCHIKNDAPKMAICVYHLKDDFWKIPQLILSISPEYDFIYRQHRPDVYTETVIYAIPRAIKQAAPPALDTQTKFSRLTNALEGIRILPSEEYTNLMNNLKDKAWYLYQIRMHNDEIVRLSANRMVVEKQNREFGQELLVQKKWSMELQEAKDYLVGQLDSTNTHSKELEQALGEQKKWSMELQEAKDYLVGQLDSTNTHSKELEQALGEQKKWSMELQEAKDYLVGQLDSTNTHSKELEQALGEQKEWSVELQEAKDYLDQQNLGYSNTITELRGWTEQLQQGKDYLESVSEQQKDQLSHAEAKCKDYETKIADLENDLAKLWYKYNRLVTDSFVKKVIKFKKLDL